MTTTQILAYLVGILGIMFLVLSVLYFKLHKKANELADAIRETALESYDVGWNDAVDNMATTKKIMKELRAES